MGLTVVLEDENGAPVRGSVHDPANALSRLLPDPADTSFPLLRFVDPYGDTIFNRRQMAELRAEWARLYERAGSEQEEAILREVDALAAAGASEPHLYLRFVGD